MDAAAEIGRNPVSKHQIQPECGERAGYRGTGLPNLSRETISREEREQGKVHFLFSADGEQDWQPYPVDSYLAISHEHTVYIAGQ